MTWLVEEPLYIAVLGTLTLAVLGFAWMQTRVRGLLYALLTVAALTLLLLVVERWVTTESEVIQDTLFQMARDVQGNDADAVLRHLSSWASATTRRRAAAEMENYRFDSVRVRSVEQILFDPPLPDAERTPPFPVAEVNCLVRAAGARRATGETGHVNVDVQLTLLKEDDRWRIWTYSYQLPFGPINR